MDKYKLVKSIWMVFLICIALAGFVLFFLAQKEKNDLLFAVGQLNTEIGDLQSEKKTLQEELEAKKQLEEKLVRENSRLQDDLQASQEQVAMLNANFKAAQEKIEQISLEMQDFKLKSASLLAEKETLQIKLGSLPELKKCIRELKQKMAKVKRDLKNKVKRRETVEGNRGFVVKNGKFTRQEHKVRIEVTPAYLGGL